MSRAYETIIAGLNSFDPDERRLSVEASVKFGDREEVVDKLIDLLKDRDKGVRDAVANALVLIANEFEKSKKKIIKGICSLIQCEDIGLKNLSAELIFKIGKDALDEIKELANHRDKDVRKIAVDIIGLLNEKSMFDFLKEKLNDPNPNVITSAIEAIGNIGDDSAIEVLIDSFSKFEFAQIQIIEALGKIGEKVKDKKIICDFLMETFESSDDPILKSAVVEALGKVGDESHINFLMDLTLNQNIAIQKMAIVSLVEICARLDCKLNANKYFFKSFFKQGVEIFFEMNEPEFKIKFLNFASKWIKFDEVKSFILSLIDGNEKISEKVFEIARANAKDLISFSLKNSIESEKFINLIEAILCDAEKVFENIELKKAVLQKLTELFYEADIERKIMILNLLSSLDEIEFMKLLNESQDDPILKMYFGLV
ncbi:HEAT repeat domain-containing protein [Candidatus Kryptobacter tengchongensis]|uniref:HEAT repeat n=1 Tax=Kryptobacter tengchongensis TaxID=1643429 RepID=A0A916PAX6_KRYT1|nr:HEAT repeat domain-containing protein [Candidatus Kryptobacter tengchongensis]CUS97278.1 HEAT repeat [Candidatus Kryptobacter tengchongensis]